MLEVEKGIGNKNSGKVKHTSFFRNFVNFPHIFFSNKTLAICAKYSPGKYTKAIQNANLWPIYGVKCTIALAYIQIS